MYHLCTWKQQTLKKVRDESNKTVVTKTIGKFIKSLDHVQQQEV